MIMLEGITIFYTIMLNFIEKHITIIVVGYLQDLHRTKIVFVFKHNAYSGTSLQHNNIYYIQIVF